MAGVFLLLRSRDAPFFVPILGGGERHGKPYSGYYR